MHAIVYGLLIVAGLYLVFGAFIVVTMLQPPVRFGRVMRRLPMALVWGVLPGPMLWSWARRGALRVGDRAPDFTLPTRDRQQQVTLSAFHGDRPVVLVFGSYT